MITLQTPALTTVKLGTLEVGDCYIRCEGHAGEDTSPCMVVKPYLITAKKNKVLVVHLAIALVSYMSTDIDVIKLQAVMRIHH